MSNSITLRAKLLRLCEQQNHRCAYCGVEMLHPSLKQRKPKVFRANPPWPAVSWSCHGKAKKFRRATLDHVIPRSQGGTDAFSNLVAACKFCNFYRGNQPAEQAFARVQRLLRRKTHPHIVFKEHGRFPKCVGFLPIVEGPHAP